MRRRGDQPTAAFLTHARVAFFTPKDMKWRLEEGESFTTTIVSKGKVLDGDALRRRRRGRGRSVLAVEEGDAFIEAEAFAGGGLVEDFLDGSGHGVIHMKSQAQG